MYLLDSNLLSDEEKQEFNEKYLISSVPTLIVIENGKIKNIELGYFSQNLINKVIEESN